MRQGIQRQRGFMVLAIVLVVVLVAVALLVSNLGKILTGTFGRFSVTQTSLNRIEGALVEFAATHQRLPCPARPTGAANPGWPNDDNTQPTSAITACAYPDGVVPWAVLGLSQEQATDEWGRLISYRVFNGSYGLTQNLGASAVNCDIDNGTSAETPPIGGICDSGNNTLATSFISHSTYVGTPLLNTKGFIVNDFSQNVNAVAFVLISHGPSGLGAYLPNGIRMAMPGATASDYDNTQKQDILGASFKKLAPSASDVVPGAAGHFDDIVNYVTISDLLKRAKLEARDWPDFPSFTATTTSNMTSPSTDMANPHFMSSGSSGSGEEFVATTADGLVAVQFGSAMGSYSGCLWWPGKLALVEGNTRKALTFYMDFALAESLPDDPAAGFSLAFLSGAYTQPTNSTCGTSAVSRNATQVPLIPNQISMTDASGLAARFLVTGPGIASGTTINSFIDATTLELSANTTATVSGALQFANAPLIGRDLGWSGGSISSYANRFAIEFDAATDIGASPLAATAQDPARPHLAIDYGGVVHDGTTAESCVTTNYGAGCNMPAVDPFPAPAPVSRTATGALASQSLAITDTAGTAGILHGMPVTGIGIGAGAVVTAVSSSAVTLSVANTAAVAGAVTFGTVSSSNFMQNGFSVFHGIRAELTPQACTGKTATGALAASTITVTDATGLVVGMGVFGAGIAPGATVTGIAGTTVTLLLANVAAIVAGPVNFAWPPATKKSASAVQPAGVNDISVTDVTGLSIGMTVTGSGVASGSTITAIAGTTAILSLAKVGAVSGSLSFAWPAALSQTATGTLGQLGIDVSSISGIGIGMLVSGTGIGTGAAVTGVAANPFPSTTYTVSLSVANTASLAPETVTFAPRQSQPALLASGTAGQPVISVSSTAGIVVGMTAYGTGIADGATVTATTPTTVSLSSANTATVTGTVSFLPSPLLSRTLVKSWTLSNAGCNTSPPTCAAFKDTSSIFSEYLSGNDQALHAVTCIATPTPATAFNTFYFGFTTANGATGGTSSTNTPNILFRSLQVRSRIL